MQERHQSAQDRPLRASVLVALSLVVVALVILSGFGPGTPRGSAHVVPTPFCTATGPYTVCSDQQDYVPSSTVHLSGSGFTGSTVVTMKITRPDGTIVKSDGTPGSDDLTTSAGGSFQYDYVLNGVLGEYLVEVLDGAAAGGALLATHSFHDGGTSFLQCANDRSPTPLGSCFWIGSILQANNSKYIEGMSTLQRLIFLDIGTTTGNEHTLTFSHQAEKTNASTHAYDFLTSWDQAVSAADATSPAGLLATLNECGASGQAAFLAACSTLRSGSNTATPSLPDAMGTILGDDVASRVTAYEGIFGNRTLKIYGDATITSASVSFDGYSGSSDFDAEYTLSWTSASTDILIEVGGHIAVGFDPLVAGIGYGVGKGAASISGGPYHFKLAQLDDASIGSQDNQLKGADVELPPLVPALTTDVHNDGTHVTVTKVAVGTAVHDEATLTSTDPFEAGDITFTLYDNLSCDGNVVNAQDVAFGAGGVTVVVESSTKAALSPGSYSYQASYAGDSNHTSQTGACEPFTVNPVKPALSTDVHDGSHVTVTQVPDGTSVHDEATLASTLVFQAGVITFTLYPTSDCTGTPVNTPQNVGFSAGVSPRVVESSTKGALGPGNYSYQASYAGDNNHSGQTGACEPFAVNPFGKPALNTAVHNGAEAIVTEVTVGTAVHDEATLTSTVAFEAGDITFTLYDNGTCDGNVVNTQDVAFGAGGGPIVRESSEKAALSAGDYSYQASYPGDASHASQTGACEPFAVILLVPALSTDVHNDGTHATVTKVTLGTAVHDEATLTSTSSFEAGDITFTLYDNATCDGNVVNTQDVAFGAGGGPIVRESSEKAALAAGDYSYRASYAGDSNHSSQTGACEPFTVNRSKPGVLNEAHDEFHTSITNVPRGTAVHAEAALTETILTSPFGFESGVVTFTLYPSDDCTGVRVNPSESVAFSAGPGPIVVESTAKVALFPGVYSYQAVYLGDSNHTSQTGACEPFTVDQAKPGLTTEVHNIAHSDITNLVVDPGTLIHDEATLTSTFDFEAGIITFRLYASGNCMGALANVQNVAFGAGFGPIVVESSIKAALSPGSYSYEASYAGDNNHSGQTGACEPFAVELVKPGLSTAVHNAAHIPITNLVVVEATAVHDQATLTSTVDFESGDITFTLYDNGTCDGNVVNTQDVAFGAGGGPIVRESSEKPALSAGDYSYRASYAGDSNHSSQTGACEPFSVIPPPPNQGAAILTLGVKPCDPKRTPLCDRAEMLVKDEITVSVEMKEFNIPGMPGYDAWETSVCFPHNDLAFQSQEFKGGPQGNQVVGAQAPNAVNALISCVLLGASVGAGEDSSQDFGNLANLNFTCKNPSKAISVFTLPDGLVILGDNDSKEVGQNPDFIGLDCRSGSVSAHANGGFFTEHDDIGDPDNLDPNAIRVHVKAGDKFKVTVSIDDLRNLDDKDNHPGDGGGYTTVEATVGYNDAEVSVSVGHEGMVAMALVPCTGAPNDEAVITQATNEITLSCKSDNVAPASDENQGAGDVFTITFQCADDGDSSKSEITLDSVLLEGENKQFVNVFNETSTIIIECIGDLDNKDGDGCTHEEEATLNLQSQELAGIDFMDPNVYDWPDAKAITPNTISVGDILAYVQNFGLNNPALGPPTDLGALSNPPANVHDVSQPNDDGIGTDDILRVALLFGTSC